jgi:pilus assembly protein CpaB
VRDRHASTAPSTRARRLWRDARRLGRRYQRWVGAGLIGLGALLTMSVLAPPPAATVMMTVAARDLPAGTRLVAGDLRDVPAPATVVPPSALDRSGALGEVLLAPVGAGETITAARLSGSGLLAGTPSGTVALPVRLADPGAAALLVPGDRVDLVAAVASDAEPPGARVVGRDLVVLHAPGSTGSAGALDADDLLGGLVVVAASDDQALEVITGAAEGPLSAILRGTR